MSWSEADSGPSNEFQDVIRTLRLRIGDQPSQACVGGSTPRWKVESQPLARNFAAEDAGDTYYEDVTPEQRATNLQCVDEALDVMGRTGKEVFYEILLRRYGLDKDGIVDSPGRFMTSLKVLMEGSARVLELYALDEFEKKLGISASTYEEAVATLKGRNHPSRPLESDNAPMCSTAVAGGARVAIRFSSQAWNVKAAKGMLPGPKHRPPP